MQYSKRFKYRTLMVGGTAATKETTIRPKKLLDVQHGSVPLCWRIVGLPWTMWNNLYPVNVLENFSIFLGLFQLI